MVGVLMWCMGEGQRDAGTSPHSGMMIPLHTCHLHAPPPCAWRSYHSATVVGQDVWLCGGGSTDSVAGDVVVFTPLTRSWRVPALRGQTALLKRTAHGACQHPTRPACIVLFGGYGGEGADSQGQDFRYLNDLVLLDTRTGGAAAAAAAVALCLCECIWVCIWVYLQAWYRKRPACSLSLPRGAPVWCFVSLPRWVHSTLAAASSNACPWPTPRRPCRCHCPCRWRRQGRGAGGQRLAARPPGLHRLCGIWPPVLCHWRPHPRQPPEQEQTNAAGVGLHQRQVDHAR